MQEYAEYAVQHLAGELQDFEKNLKRRKKKNYPFYNGIKDKDCEPATQAVKGSERYKCSREMCPNCKRPAFYIRKN